MRLEKQFRQCDWKNSLDSEIQTTFYRVYSNKQLCHSHVRFRRLVVCASPLPSVSVLAVVCVVIDARCDESV